MYASHRESKLGHLRTFFLPSVMTLFVSIEAFKVLRNGLSTNWTGPKGIFINRDYDFFYFDNKSLRVHGLFRKVSVIDTVCKKT